MRPPVFRPKVVPRSYTRLNSTYLPVCVEERTECEKGVGGRRRQHVRDLAHIIAETPMVAEGVRSAAPLVAMARDLGVELPSVERILDIIEGRLTPLQAVRQLMERPAGGEWDAMGDLGFSN